METADDFMLFPDDLSVFCTKIIDSHPDEKYCFRNLDSRTISDSPSEVFLHYSV